MLSSSQTYVVEEPNNAHAKEAPPVELQNEEVGGLFPHGVFGKVFGLLESQSQDKQDQGEDDADTQAGSPDGAVVAIVSCSRNHI